jgi:hypothetical protein
MTDASGSGRELIYVAGELALDPGRAVRGQEVLRGCPVKECDGFPQALLSDFRVLRIPDPPDGRLDPGPIGAVPSVCDPAELHALLGALDIRHRFLAMDITLSSLK